MIPGQGTKILHIVRLGQKVKIKKKKSKNKKKKKSNKIFCSPEIGFGDLKLNEMM